MRRILVLWPPSQSELQSLQSNQSLHLQSTYTHGPASHDLIWLSSRPQPMPPSCGCCRTRRMRWCWPGPQVEEQASQADHSPTKQSTLLHGLLLHPLVSIRSTGHDLPPSRAFCVTWRCRCCCPPLHVLSHSSHALHSETTQSTAKLHSWISCKLASQGSPPFSGSWIVRWRKRWPLPLQALHSSQCPISHDLFSSPQKPVLQT
mmetsp:Transcript_32598/g.103395  ORF Transcript_32598/g.103395 Transcript_32598/m.103395 type:complete len:204 (-) Transcript_32598:2881-3492(-)